MSAEPYAHAERSCFPWSEEVDFSQAVISSAPLVFSSGQGPFGADGSLLAAGDPAGQMRQTYDNLATVLEAAGSSLDAVLTQTVYLARAEDFPVFKEVRREYFSPPYPATTTLRVDLLEPGMLVELNAVAAVGATRRERPR